MNFFFNLIISRSACDIIWSARNKFFFEGSWVSIYSARLWTRIRDTNKLKLGNMLNRMEDLLIIHRLGVPRIHPKSDYITKVNWKFRMHWICFPRRNHGFYIWVIYIFVQNRSEYYILIHYLQHILNKFKLTISSTIILRVAIRVSCRVLSCWLFFGPRPDPTHLVVFTYRAVSCSCRVLSCYPLTTH